MKTYFFGSRACSTTMLREDNAEQVERGDERGQGRRKARPVFGSTILAGRTLKPPPAGTSIVMPFQKLSQPVTHLATSFNSFTST